MTKDEQHRLIESIRQHRSRMNKEEGAAFDMLAKRDRDDEDLDAISRRKLNEMYATHVAKRSREELEEKWKKLTGHE